MTLQEKFFKDGRLLTIPRKLASKQECFAYLTKELSQEGTTFTEKEINAFLKQYYDDFAILRRYLVDYGYLTRDAYGQTYQINEE